MLLSSGFNYVRKFRLQVKDVLQFYVITHHSKFYFQDSVAF